MQTIDEITLEYGHGQTYDDGNVTIYGHGDYEESSVLAGQRSRNFLESFEVDGDTPEALAQAKDKARGWIKDNYPNLPVNDLIDDDTKTSGTTHVDVDRMTAHLPDDDDF